MNNFIWTETKFNLFFHNEFINAIDVFGIDLGTDNQFHNILRLLDALPNFLFTTKETMGHYYLEA